MTIAPTIAAISMAIAQKITPTIRTPFTISAILTTLTIIMSPPLPE